MGNLDGARHPTQEQEPLEPMGKKNKKRRRASSADTAETPTGSLANLLQAQGFAASSSTQERGAVDQEPATAQSQDVVAQAQRWIVRISKKGRGGREATLLCPRGLPEKTELSSLARRIRKQMGCGASLEGSDILVQGDQRERLEAWLLKQGARKVTQG